MAVMATVKSPRVAARLGAAFFTASPPPASGKFHQDAGGEHFSQSYVYMYIVNLAKFLVNTFAL